MRDFWEFVIDLLPITFRSVSVVGLERPRGQNPRGRGHNPRGQGRDHNPRGRGQVFWPRGRGQALMPNIPAYTVPHICYYSFLFTALEIVSSCLVLLMSIWLSLPTCWAGGSYIWYSLSWQMYILWLYRSNSNCGFIQSCVNNLMI